MPDPLIFQVLTLTSMCIPKGLCFLLHFLFPRHLLSFPIMIWAAYRIGVRRKNSPDCSGPGLEPYRGLRAISGPILSTLPSAFSSEWFSVFSCSAPPGRLFVDGKQLFAVGGYLRTDIPPSLNEK